MHSTCTSNSVHQLNCKCQFYKQSDDLPGKQPKTTLTWSPRTVTECYSGDHRSQKAACFSLSSSLSFPSFIYLASTLPITIIQGTQSTSKSPLPLINEHSLLNSWLVFASGCPSNHIYSFQVNLPKTVILANHSSGHEFRAAPYGLVCQVHSSPYGLSSQIRNLD